METSGVSSVLSTCCEVLPQFWLLNVFKKEVNSAGNKNSSFQKNFPYVWTGP